MPPRVLLGLCSVAALASSTFAPGSARAAAPPAPAPASPPTAAEAPRSGPPRLIPLSEIKPGMTGYGLTVFHGTKPERFRIKVIGILHNFLPTEDVILIECDDDRLRHSGIVAGMSGSPIYLDGDRLAGALAYGWHFSKDPIAGVTPIDNMLAELRRPLRGREHTPVASAANDRAFQSPAAREAPIARAPRVTEARPGDPLSPSLEQAAVPLSISGFGPLAFEELSRTLAPYHVTPLAAGGGSTGRAGGPERFEPGGAIAVELIRGDMSAAATGTVTWVDGDKVLAFGHPMFNLGEIYLPIATAEVHTVLAAVSSSFKIASPIREVGTLMQDRQSCIVGDIGQRADMIPVSVKVGSPGHAGKTFSASVVRHRFLTPMLAAAVIANAAQATASDVADATITVHTSLGVRGFQPLELVDHAFSEEGVSNKALAGLAGMKAIGDILFNPFTPANLDRIDVQVDVDYRPDVAMITGVTLNTDALEPGTRPSLRVSLRPYNGPEYTESVPIDVPRALAGSLVRIEAAAGNLVKQDLAPPENLYSLMENLRSTYPARAIVVTLQTPDEGLALRGSVVSQLPGSVFDTLRPGASTRRGDTFKQAARIVVPTRGVVVGKQEIQVKVKEEAVR